MADKVNNITTRFTADVSSFLKDTQAMKRGINQANAEFKNATAGMSKWQDSTEGLQAKLTQLNNIVQIEKKRLADMVAEYDELEKAGKANTAQAQRLATQILNQGAKVKRAEADIAKYEKSLEEMGDEAEKGGKKVKDLGDKAKDSGDGFTVAKGAIAGFIANGLTALAGAAKNAISNVLGLAEATREYRSTLATLDTAAKDAGVNTDKIRDKFTDLMGVFNDEDSVTEGLNNLMAAGFDEKNIDAITAQLEGAAIKFKDTLKFEGVSDGLQETLATGKAIGPFAELLERSGVNLETFDKGLAKATTSADKQNYVLQELSKLGLSEVSESYREQNKDMVAAQKANVDYQNTVAKAGAKIEPITTKIREGFTRILEKVLELAEGVDFEALGAMIDGAFDTFINDIIPKIVDGLQWIIDNKDIIIGVVTGIGAAFVAWKVVGIITSVVGAIKKMSTAFSILNAVMKANVIGIIVTAVVGLVAAFIYLWKNCDEFRAFWINLWEGIKKAAGVAWQAIKGFFKSAWEWIKGVWKGAGKWFSSVWSGIRNAFSAVGSWFSNLFQKAWNGVKNAWSGTKKFFSNVWSGIKNTFSSVSSWFGNIFKKAWSAVKNAFSAVGSFFGGIWETIKSKFTSIGTKVGDAIGGAFKKAINTVLSTVENAINNIPRAINGAIKTINKIAGTSIGEMGYVSLPRLAKGGIVDKATIAQIGEAGREAVIPLERNTQGMKEIASMITDQLKSSGMGGMNVTYNQTFSKMPTTRYAIRKAMSDTKGMYQLYEAVKGGV